MNKLTACAALFALLNLNSPPTMSATHELKILTYNIYHGERFYHPGQPNLSEIAQVINDCQPDLVALQEVDRHTRRSAALYGGTPQDLAANLAQMTGLHASFGKAMEQHGGDYGDAILSRAPSLTPANTLILDAPEGGEPRALLTIDYPLPEGSGTLTFAATHLCHLSETSRLAQVQQILETLGPLAQPVILAGDFNFENGEAPYHHLATAMEDTGQTIGNTANTWPTDAPNTRLDIVFLDRNHHWKVKAVRLIETDASDHLPVLVTLELQTD